MNLHEYQGKQLLQQNEIQLPSFVVVDQGISDNDLYQKIATIPGSKVIKAQIHAGGRGKGKIYDQANIQSRKLLLDGGVQIRKNDEEVFQVVRLMLGNFLQTAQTSDVGRQIHHVYIETASDIAREFYMSFLFENGNPVVMYSAAGGINIEEVAHKQPDKIYRSIMNLYIGLYDFQCREILFRLGLIPNSEKIILLKKLAQVFINSDASMLEINPLIETSQNNLLPLDCKFSLDDNARYRQPHIVEMRDRNEEEPLELKASEFGLNYIKLEGSVGCMVNGAGLAMATMDFVKPLGGEPANFLDVGGGASVATVSKAFQILNEDSNVKIIFINIFGGIVQCDRVANGILQAIQQIHLRNPLLIRLQGTHAKEAREIFAKNRQSISVDCAVVEDLEDAGTHLQHFFQYGNLS